MADIIRGGEASLQLPGRGSVWGDANTPDPTGDLIKNIKERKKEFKDFYNTQKEEVDALNESLKGMQGRDFADMQNKIVDTRNQIAKLYSEANMKNYNSPEFQAKLYKIKDDFVQMKNTLDTSAGELAKATEFVKVRPHVAREEAMNYINEQAKLPYSQREKNPFSVISNDPKFYNPSAALDDAVKSLGKDAEITYDIQDGPYNRTMERKYNTALYKNNKGKLVFDPAPELLDTLLKDPRMVNQVVNWLPPDKAKALTELGEGQKADAIKSHLIGFMKANESIKQRFEPTDKEIRVSKQSSTSAAGLRKQDEEKANMALWENAQKNPEAAVSGYILENKEQEGPIAAKPVTRDGETVGYTVTFRKNNTNEIEKFNKPWIDEEKFISIKSFGDRESFFNQVVNPYEDKRNTRKQTGEVSKPSNYTIKGKEYSHGQIEKAAKASGVTVEQYLKAINK